MHPLLKVCVAHIASLQVSAIELFFKFFFSNESAASIKLSKGDT